MSLKSLSSHCPISNASMCPITRAFYFVKWSGKQILNCYWSVAGIASKKRLCSLQNMQSTENAEIMQSADHTVCRPYNLQTIQSVNHTSCRPFILQTILSDDHTVWRMHSLQPIWSVSSFLQAIGLGISFLASPEKNALGEALPKSWKIPTFFYPFPKSYFSLSTLIIYTGYKLTFCFSR